MTDMVEIKAEGMPQLSRVLSAVQGSFDRWDLLFEGLIRPTKVQDGKGWVIDPAYTLEGATRAAFESGGRSVYHDSTWEDLSDEPNYALRKAMNGGGSRMLIWESSQNSLMDSLLNPSHKDHIEEVSKTGVKWGTSKHYALRLQEGGFHQPWDDVTPGPRPIIVVNDLMAFHLAKGAQRIMMAEIRQNTTGDTRGAALAAIRTFA